MNTSLTVCCQCIVDQRERTAEAEKVKSSNNNTICSLIVTILLSHHLHCGQKIIINNVSNNNS